MREGYSTACPRWALLGWSDALSALMAFTHCRPGLQQWQQSPDTVRPPTTTRMSTTVCQAGRKTHGLQQGPYPQCSSPIPGPGRAPRLLPPCSGALWGAANRVTRPGFLNAAHSHSGGIPHGCVRAGKVVYILCLAWKRPWLTRSEGF